LFEDIGLGFELGDLAAQEVATLTSVAPAGDDDDTASGRERERRRWEGGAGMTGVSSFAGDITDTVQFGWEGKVFEQFVVMFMGFDMVPEDRGR
jgi:hypothetical protein